MLSTAPGAGCLFPCGPVGITHRKSEEGHRKYRMKIMHFGANLKVDHLGSNHQAKRGDLLPIWLSPCVTQTLIQYIWYKKEWFTLFHSHFLLHLNLTDSNPSVWCGQHIPHHALCGILCFPLLEITLYGQIFAWNRMNFAIQNSPNTRYFVLLG